MRPKLKHNGTAARPKITAIRFRPPVVVARVGDSDSPLEAFSWVEDTQLFGSAKTIISPTVSLEVLPDGSVEPYNSGPIRFRDGLAIRPVCPFLELEAEVEYEAFQPLTSTLLERAGIDLSQLHFRVIAANLKAQRQSSDAESAFEARLELPATDHDRHDLWAWTHSVGSNSLVSRDRPIWLGAFQVIRPARRENRYDICVDTIRVRFTPGRGTVYGPPFAIKGQTIESRGPHTVVPTGNRILNPDASWCKYDIDVDPSAFMSPDDVYDGNEDLDRSNRGFGVVDDTCDAIITASLGTFFELGKPRRPTAMARVLVGPPHFSPDRRHLYSFADDLADRDPDNLAKGSARTSQSIVVMETNMTLEEWEEAVTDLFRRIWETGSQVNLEAHRDFNLTRNEGVLNPRGFPAISDKSMTDKDFVDGHRMISNRFLFLATQDAGDGANEAPLLPKAEYARMRHAELATPEVLLRFMVEQPERFRELLRPPFRKMSDPMPKHKRPKPGDFRDPRRRRSYAFDARMPPFLRDCDFSPLSLTRRQWELIFAKDGTGTSLAARALDARRTK